MGFIDWYIVLAIEPSADVATVRRAYRRAALKYHPDKNPDEAAADQFDLLGQALTVLTDPERRAEFDSLRARRNAASAARANESERIRELKAKLESPAPADKVTYTNDDLERLRQESYEHRRTLDALLEQQSRNASSKACRTLADGSRTFATVTEAREYVDTHPGARLQASWRPGKYTKEYEKATLDRLTRLSTGS